MGLAVVLDVLNSCHRRDTVTGGPGVDYTNTIESVLSPSTLGSAPLTALSGLHNIGAISLYMRYSDIQICFFFFSLLQTRQLNLHKITCGLNATVGYARVSCDLDLVDTSSCTCLNPAHINYANMKNDMDIPTGIQPSPRRK